MRLALVLAVLTLAACGADGPPVAPSKAEQGISITGRAEIGISG